MNSLIISVVKSHRKVIQKLFKKVVEKRFLINFGRLTQFSGEWSFRVENEKKEKTCGNAALWYICLTEYTAFRSVHRSKSTPFVLLCKRVRRQSQFCTWATRFDLSSTWRYCSVIIYVDYVAPGTGVFQIWEVHQRWYLWGNTNVLLITTTSYAL